MLSLENKHAVVTGAGSGIGRSIAGLFARQGATVHVVDRDIQAAAAVVAAILEAGGKAQAHECDVSDPAAVDAMFLTIATGANRVDILVNNAGIAHVGTVETTEPEDLDRVYAVNVKGVYACLRAGVRQMVLQGGGVIVNMASIASKIGVKDRFAYSMSKGAVLTMTLSVATDYVKKNIRCNCICPARVHTPFVDGYLAKNFPGREVEMLKSLSEYQPIGRMGTPDEVATLALYLCSDEASFLTGTAYDIDGGVISLT